MSKKIHLILGNQLFFDQNIFERCVDFLLVESKEISSRFHYHKYKLAYIFSWMREFRNWLKKNFVDKKIYYFDITQQKSFDQVFEQISKEYDELLFFEITDKSFETWILQLAGKYFNKITFINTPYFLNSDKQNKEFLKQNGVKKLLFNNFYIWQRKRLDILTVNYKPFGGKWSFDDENRKKLPGQIEIKSRQYYSSLIYSEVTSNVEKFFPSNPGDICEESWLPLNLEQVENFVQKFFEERFEYFGDYEDAISSIDHLLYHSGFSALINIGVLTPRRILEKLNKYLIENFDFSIYKPKENYELKLNSIEGYIRQLIGWREWMNLVYRNIYDKDLCKYNLFNHTKKLPEYFWTLENLEQELEFNTPLLKALINLRNNAYNHHIERLMILANWMVLNEYDPIECYNWFMSMYIDAYEWVMVGNVIGLGLFADGGLFATKPYIAGGNYLKKMSDFKDSKKWETTWTSIYWQFVQKHEIIFSQNPRMKLLLKRKKPKD